MIKIINVNHLIYFIKVCEEMFIKSFVFDIFSFLTSEITNILWRVQKLIHNNSVPSKIINIIFKRMNFLFQKV